MPSIVETLTGSIVFLFDGNRKTPLGTGFVLGYPVAPGSQRVIPLIVTARHVIGDRAVVLGRFSTRTGGTTGFVEYDLDATRKDNDAWVHNDDGVDVLVFRTSHYDQLNYNVVPLSAVASKQTVVDEDIKATDRVVFPTMLSNFMGSTRNYPVTRDGTIALIPEELVPLEFEVGARKIKTQQEVIFLDATSIPGASGSPVFLWPGSRLKNNAIMIGGGQAWLLGVMHGFYPAEPREILRVQTTGTWELFAENSRIAIVFPAWRILEILDAPNTKLRLDELISEIPPESPEALEPARAPEVPQPS
jgi:hypothetical protein